MAEKIKKSFPKAVGVSGNRGLYGDADTGEYLAKLDGYNSRSIFDKMRRNDPQIKSTLLGITLPIRQADYYIDPIIPENDEIAEKLDIMRNKMSMTWDDTIRHILLEFVFGFMVMEKVYRYDEIEGLVVPEKLAPRMPITIDEWKYDESKDQLLGPVQANELGKETILPIKRILVFTTDREGDNWEGISLLRAMFGPWYIKQRLLKIDAIKHDRHGTGIPVMKVPDGIKEGSDEWDNAEETVTKIHSCEKGGLVLPFGYEFDIKTVENNGGTDVIPSLQYSDYQISRAGFQMFTNLGQEKTGSYSLGKSFIEIFLQSTQTYADYICEVMNRFWIKEIVDYNWKVKEYPQLKARRIKKLDGTTLSLLMKSGLISKDFDLENVIRREYDLPEKDEKDIEEKPEEPKTDPEEKPDKEKQDPDSIDDEENMRYARIDRTKSALSNIELSEIEKIPNLMAIEMALDTASDELDDELFEIKAMQVDDLIMQVIGGKKIQNLRVILKKEMYQIAIKKYKEMVKEGRKEVIEELNNQGAKIEMKLQGIDYEDLAGYTDDELAILIEKSSDVLKTHLMIHAIEERKRGIVNNDELKKTLKEAASDVSDLHWKSISAVAVNGGWGAGRRLAEQEFADDIEYSYYSAILDGNICPACLETSQMAGSQNHRPGDPLFTVPNPKCYSTKSTGQGNFCRCFNINVYKQETEEPLIAERS